jgi:hypothetical protein
MGGGAKRREHHRQQEAMRSATRQTNAFEAQMRAAEDRNQQLAEALKPVPQKYTPPPVTTNAMLGMRGVKPNKPRKAGTLGSRRGIASLRIPLNIGSTPGGTNIPS